MGKIIMSAGVNISKIIIACFVAGTVVYLLWILVRVWLRVQGNGKNNYVCGC